MRDLILKYLGRTAETLSYDGSLEDIEKILIHHQINYPFETITRNFNTDIIMNPKFEKHFANFLETRYCGTCFSHHYVLKNVLEYLGYSVFYIFLKPNHCAIVLDWNNQLFYLDVAYWAPLFKPLPLKENWHIDFPDINVSWRIEENCYKLIRNGVLVKTWDGLYLDDEEFYRKSQEILSEDSYFKEHLIINRWLDLESFILLENNKLKIYNRNCNKKKEFSMTHLNVKELISKLFI